MPYHKIKTEHGIMPKVNPRLLPDGYAQVAENCILETGIIQPYFMPSNIFTLPDDNQRSIYRYYNDDGSLTLDLSGCSLATLQSVKNGSFTANFDGRAYVIGGIDLTGISAKSEIAAIIQSAIRAVTGSLETVTYNAGTDMLTITGKSISYLTAGETNVTGNTGNDCMADMTSDTYPTGEIVVGTALASTKGWFAADFNGATGLATGWKGAYLDHSDGAVNVWWQYQFPRKRVIDSFRMYTGSSGNLYWPLSFKLQGNNDINPVTFNATANTVGWVGHPVSSGDSVNFVDITGTTGITVGPTYYARDIATDTFKVASVPGGAAINLTTDGTGTIRAWTNIETYTNTTHTANTWAAYTVTAGNQGSWQNYRVHISTVHSTDPVGIGSAVWIYEIEFFHTPLDISGASYLNGLTGGTAVLSNANPAEWMYWTESNISVANSPIYGDMYRRIYWTGEADGHMYTRGSFAKRRIYIPAPSVVTHALTSIYTKNPGTILARFKVTTATPSFEYANCTLVSWTDTPTGFELKFNFPGYTTTNATGYGAYSWEIGDGTAGTTLPGTAIPNPMTIADIEVKYPQTNGTVEWANVELKSINGSSVEARSYSAIGPTYTQTWAQGVLTVIINMNYASVGSDRFYIMTYVNDHGEEGPIGVLSAMAAKKSYDKITLTLPVSADPTVTKKRVYRTGTGSSTATDSVLFLVELANATTTYVDWLNDEDLNEPIQYHYNPPDGLQGLIAHPGGFLVAFKGKEVWFSERTLPYSWKEAYVITVDTQIVGLASSGSDIYVLTIGSPYIISGDDPANFSQAKLPLDQSCVSWRSIKRVKSMVVYASPDGLVGLSGGQGRVLTDTSYDKPHWTAILPSTIRADVFDLKYFLFSDSTAIIFDFSDDGNHQIVTTDETAAGLFSDIRADRLYFIDTHYIKEWDGDTASRLLKWKTKQFQYPRPVFFNAARIIAEAYGTGDVVLKVYAEEVLVHTRIVTSDQSFRLPTLRPERRWSFAIESKYEIYEIGVSGSMEELLQG